MSCLALVTLDPQGVAPRPISPKLRLQLVYFGAPPAGAGTPVLGENEYWFRPDEIDALVDEGVIYIVSPLDGENMTEVELSEEQESLLIWIQKERVRHVRVVE